MPDLPTVVCYGDSNTHGAIGATGLRYPREVRWPGVVARELAGRAHVVEEGLNGRTTIWDDPFSPGRNGRDYLRPCLDSHAPVAVVVIMLGTNDLKSILRLGPAEIAAGAGSLVDVARESASGPDGGPPAVLLVAPPPLGAATISSGAVGVRRGAGDVAAARPALPGGRGASPARPSSTPAPWSTADPRTASTWIRRRTRRSGGRSPGRRRPSPGLGRARSRLHPRGAVESPGQRGGRTVARRRATGGVRNVRAPRRRVAGNARPPRGEDQRHRDESAAGQPAAG